MENVTTLDVESKILTIRNQQVILDCDVAELYGVETKEINQAVKNNPEKFPEGYVFKLDSQEFSDLRSKFLTAKFQMTRMSPKAFTDKGLTRPYVSSILRTVVPAWLVPRQTADCR